MLYGMADLDILLEEQGRSLDVERIEAMTRELKRRFWPEPAPRKPRPKRYGKSDLEIMWDLESGIGMEQKALSLAVAVATVFMTAGIVAVFALALR